MVVDFIHKKYNVVTEEANTMKKILMISAVIVFALALGVAYADDMSGGMSKWDNGITIFATGPVSTGINFRAGSVDLEREVALARPESLGLDNGVTVFANSYKGEVISGEEGMAAGGYAGEEAPLDLYNGITSFDSHPIDAN
jgi:hypothetical protein